VTRLRIAIVVPGRFHAFDLARELIALGHDVTVFTSHPAWAARRYGIGRQDVRSAWWHGALARGLARVPNGLRAAAESWSCRRFGRWAARALESRHWDVVHVWSGVAEEVLESAKVSAAARVLMRGSAHVSIQDELLGVEAARIGVPLDRPSSWMVAREQREYALADRVLVLSEFARRSFERCGYDPDRLSVLPLGVDVRMFTPPAGIVAARVKRIGDGGALRVLYVGALSAQKGLFDLMEVARQCQPAAIEFTLIGPVLPETSALLTRAGSNVVVLARRDQHDLPQIYQEADLFIFPTVQDGYGMVLAQARAAGLPILCTTNCAGPDFISEGRDGWIVPIRAPEAFAARLCWCDEHRRELADMVASIDTSAVPRDWSAVAREFAALVPAWMAAAASRRSRA
jgi:glycosyltransferase involved in cell wall biosynthesis